MEFVQQMDSLMRLERVGLGHSKNVFEKAFVSWKLEERNRCAQFDFQTLLKCFVNALKANIKMTVRTAHFFLSFVFVALYLRKHFLNVQWWSPSHELCARYQLLMLLHST